MIRQRLDLDQCGEYRVVLPIRATQPEPTEPWSIWHALWMVLSFSALVGFWVVFAVGVYSIARWW